MHVHVTLFIIAHLLVNLTNAHCNSKSFLKGKNSNMDHQDKDMCSLHIADLVVCPEIAQTVGDAVPIVKFIDDICFK